MIAHPGRWSAPALALFLMLTSDSAQGQAGKELRCRGRGGAFVIDRVDGSTASVRFTPSARPAGTDGAGLEPGTCAFIDRTVESAEPLQVHFSASKAQLASVTDELNDPYAYWCFVVASGAKAFFKAGEQRSCKCGETAASNAAPQRSDANAGGPAGQPDPAAKKALDRFVENQPPEANAKAGQAGQAQQTSQGGGGGGLGSLIGAAGSLAGTAAKVAAAGSGVQTAISGAEAKAGAAVASAVADRIAGTGADAAKNAPAAKNAADAKAANDVKAPEGVDPRPPVITEVSAVPSAKDIAFAFKSFANITPQVEVATVPPVFGPDKRWSFPEFRPANKFEQTFLGTGPTVSLNSGVVKLLAGGNKKLGRYTANLMGALDPGIVYYYIINVRLNDDPASEIRQMKGIIHTPGSNKYEMRYRGVSSDSTGDTGSRDIYAVVSSSYFFPTGDPAILSAVPSAVVPGVRASEAHADPGKRVYNGGPADILLTVTLMQHVSGDLNKVKAAVHESFLDAVGRLLVSPTKPTGAVQLVSNAVKEAFIGGDSVIATSSRLVTAAEMKAMANSKSPKASDRGITYDFFTEHAGLAGGYKVYFDVVSR